MTNSTKFFKVSFISFFSNQSRSTVVKARNEEEAIANAKNIRPLHNYSNAIAIETEPQPTAKGVGSKHNNH